MSAPFLGILLTCAAVYFAALGAKKDLYDAAPRQLTRVGYSGASLAIVLIGLGLFAFPEDDFRTEEPLLQRVRPFFVFAGVLIFFLCLFLLGSPRDTPPASRKKARRPVSLPSPPRTGWASFGLWVSVGFGLLTAASTWLYVSDLRFHEALLKQGRTVPATLEQAKKETSGKGMVSYRVRYSYRDDRGQLHQHTSGRPSALQGTEAVPGATFEVTYLPEAPERHVPFRMTAEKWDTRRNEGRTLLWMMLLAWVEICLMSWLEPDIGRIAWFPGLLVLLVPWFALLILTGLLLFVLRARLPMVASNRPGKPSRRKR